MATPTGPMTILQAVNEIITSLPGLASSEVAALDTGGTSVQADAERYLDRAIRNTQIRGFDFVNIIEDESLTPAAVTRYTLSQTGVSLTNATKTLSKSGLVSAYTRWRRKDRVNLTAGTGITTGYYEVQSIATDTIVLTSDPGGSNPSNVTVSTVGYQYGVQVESNTLWVEAIKRFEQYSLHDDIVFAGHRNDYDMGSATPILVRRCIQMDFADLPPDIQRIVVDSAKREFQRRFNADDMRDRALEQERVESEAGQRVLAPKTNRRERAAPPILGTGPIGDGGQR